MNRGWIRFWRDLDECVSWSRGSGHISIMMTLIKDMNFKEKRFGHIKIMPGQLICGIQKLGESVRLSYQQTRTILKDLEKDGFLKIESNNRFTLITILEWDRCIKKQPGEDS